MAMTYLVKIGSTELVNLKKFEVGPNPLRGEAERNLAGDLRDSFIGYFPKLELEFTTMTVAEMKTLLTLLMPAGGNFSVSYWYALTETYKSGTFYAGEFKYGIMNKATGLYNGFGVNLIPYSKVT